jgi:hypothetical protein
MKLILSLTGPTRVEGAEAPAPIPASAPKAPTAPATARDRVAQRETQLTFKGLETQAGGEAFKFEKAEVRKPELEESDRPKKRRASQLASLLRDFEDAISRSHKEDCEKLAEEIIAEVRLASKSV